MGTPWGVAIEVTHLGVEMYRVATASHGGILIHTRLADRYLSPQAKQIGVSWGDYLAYEEDCDISAVLYEHPEFCKWRDREAVKLSAKESLQKWHPEYFQ